MEIEQESPKFKIKRQFATILLYIMHNNIYLILKKNYIYQKKKKSNLLRLLRLIST